MTHQEREVYLNGLTSSLMVQLAIQLNKEELTKNVPGESEHTSLADAHVWLAGFHDGNKLAEAIASKF
jgi:hypothetical protein